MGGPSILGESLSLCAFYTMFLEILKQTRKKNQLSISPTLFILLS